MPFTKSRSKMLLSALVILSGLVGRLAVHGGGEASFETTHHHHHSYDDDASRSSSTKSDHQQQQFTNDDDDSASASPPPTADEEQQHSYRPACGSCKMREELKNRNLEAIKGEVLRRMGFQAAPNVTGRVLPQVPPHILAKVDTGVYYSAGGGTGGGGGMMMQSDEPPREFKTGPSVIEEDDDFFVKTESVLTFAQQYPRLRHSWRNQEILHFQFSDAITKYYVANATMYVFVKGSGDASPKKSQPLVHLELFKVYNHASSADDAAGPGLLRVAARKVPQPRGRGDWVPFDATSLVGEWFKSPRENLGFAITGTTGSGKKVIVTTSDEKGTAGKVPFVEILTQEPRRRTRRSVSLNCDDKMNESVCCRYPLTVDFEEFGWDFIIAPKRYEAHYCSGDCPYLTLQKHAHTHLLKMTSPDKGGPCCAPRKMSAISMLYFDPQMNVVYGSLPGMVVDRCGCS